MSEFSGSGAHLRHRTWEILDREGRESWAGVPLTREESLECLTPTLIKGRENSRMSVWPQQGKGS